MKYARKPIMRRSFMDVLEAYWKAHPDLRFGQMLSNLVRDEKPTLFYIEDDALLVKLAEWEEREERKQ